MRTVRVSNLRGFVIATLVLGTALSVYAATPPSGTVSEASPTVTWTGPVKTSVGVLGCAGPNDPACDHFRLSIVPPSAAFGPYVVEIQLQPMLLDDWDLTVFGPNDTPVGGSGGSPSQVEVAVLNNPPAGTYTVTGVPFAVTSGYTASATLKKQTLGGGTPGGDPVTYANHVPPFPLGRDGSAEPSIGCNWKTDKAFFLGHFDTLRVTFDDCPSPPKDTWEDKTFVPTGTVTLDPILFTDRETGRTIVSQLSAKCSTMAFTDDDGETWIPSQGCGINSGVDHQTVGGGRFAAPLNRDPNGPVYPNAVYYCSQDLVAAQCARSDTGGLTFGPAVPIYATNECSGLHGQIKVSPADGTVYLPNKGCQGEQAAVVSEDNGISWHVRRVSGSTLGSWDPSVGVALDGTVYFGYGDGDGQPKIVKSTDKGLSWTSAQDVGLPFGIKNTAFPAVVAGDRNRAAFAFLGSSEPTPGGSGDDPNWPGDWFLYVAHTYDGGGTWTTVNATPNDPVQRGTLCSFGIGCSNGTRNLLDFMGATIDREGRVLVGYADGCIGDCVKARPNSFSALSTIARQVSGRRMFAASDVVNVPSAPAVSATFDTCDTKPAAVIISWSRPDDHGSPITGYNIYRRTATTSFAFLAAAGPDVNSYTDTSINPNESYFYQVKAVNARGESLACGETAPSCPGGGKPEDACVFPGKTVLEDPPNDFTNPATGQPELDLLKLSIAEPGDLGAGKIMFVLKMASMQNPPAQTTWPIQLRAPNGADFVVRMQTDALGQVSFTVATGTNTSPVTNPGVPADPASGFSPDGNIRIVVSRAAIGNPQPGEDLTQFLVRVRNPEGGAALTPDNMPDSLARTGLYKVKGSENCVCGTPDAVDDSATTTENQPVLINVVANDSDGGSPPLTVTNVGNPANGTATNNGDGTVTYRPNSGFTGTDTFNYTVRNDCGGTDSATVQITVNQRTVTCIEDDDLQIQYSNGWHLINDPNASAGHFRLNTGKDKNPHSAKLHSAKLTFDLQSQTGTLTYFFARSPKGGTAEVFLDGVSQGPISFNGPNGGYKNPDFCATCKAEFVVSGFGTHTLEFRNLNGAVYVDKFCVENGSPTGQPTSGPGATSTSLNVVAAGQELLNSLTIPAGALELSVVAEAAAGAPIRIILIDPLGAVLATADSSGGIAVIERSAAQSGLYLLKVVNLSAGPVQVWTAATPLVTR